MDEELDAAKERSWREVAAIDAAYERGEVAAIDAAYERGEVAAIDAAYERGELDDAGWHETVTAMVEPAYLTAGTIESGSGSTRDVPGWEYARSLIAAQWRLGRRSSISVVPTASLWRAWPTGKMSSRTGWRSRLSWRPSHELGSRSGPTGSGWETRSNGSRLMDSASFARMSTTFPFRAGERSSSTCSPTLGGSSSAFSMRSETRSLENKVAAWGFVISGRSERQHPHPQLAYRAFWIDAGDVMRADVSWPPRLAVGSQRA